MFAAVVVGILPFGNSMAGESDEAWYRDGLRFECTQCGQCCTGTTGYVWVTVEEVRAIARQLQLTLDDFGKNYLRRIKSRYSLLEAPDTGACVFLTENRCTIHSVRPSQCRRFPFWTSNLRDPEAWIEASKDCEGINAEAPLVDLEAIERARSS